MNDDFLESLNKAESDTEREWLLLQASLSQLDEPLQEAVWAAAIPHWFDLPYLAAILDIEPDKLVDFEELTKLSFVELFPGRGYNVHERSRILLLNQLWQTNPERYRDLSYLAAGFCADQNLEDPIWRIEWIYHLLVGDPDEGATQLQNAGWEWQNPPNFAFDLVEQLAKFAREQADGGRLTEFGVGCTLFWEARIDNRFSRYLAAKEKLEKIDIGALKDNFLVADCARDLGDAYSSLNEYRRAKEQYEIALPLFQEAGYEIGEANCIKALGDIHNQLDEYDLARSRYEEALHIYKVIGDQLGQANCIKALGDVHQRLAEYDLARNQYEEALSLYKTIGARLGQANCFKALGDIHQRMMEYELAQERYEEALSIYAQIGARLGQANCIQALGDVYVNLDEYDLARDRYEESLPIYEEIGDRLGQANGIQALGGVHQMLSEYETARNNYEEALSIYKEIGARLGEANAYTYMGDLNLAEEEFEGAKDWYEKALTIYDDIGDRHWQTYVAGNLAQAFIELGKREKAIEILEWGLEISRSIDGQPNLAWLNEWLERAKET